MFFGRSIKQNGTKDSIINIAKYIHKSRGYSGFYSGIEARLPRIFIGQAVFFNMYERMYSWLK